MISCAREQTARRLAPIVNLIFPEGFLSSLPRSVFPEWRICRMLEFWKKNLLFVSFSIGKDYFYSFPAFNRIVASLSSTNIYYC